MKKEWLFFCVFLTSGSCPAIVVTQSFCYTNPSVTNQTFRSLTAQAFLTVDGFTTQSYINGSNTTTVLQINSLALVAVSKKDHPFSTSLDIPAGNNFKKNIRG